MNYWQPFGYLSSLGLWLNFLYSGAVIAQITPDQTLGNENSIVNPIAPNFDRIDGGAIRGSHLFHSFREFNINEGHSAYFANPEAITTIFSRVTGNNPSDIMGRLGVLGNANLVFINPHGVIFGQNSSLDISGSLIVTTTNSIRFPDGNQFSAVNPQGAPLLTVDVPVPIGLVFEGDPTGKIYNHGDLAVGGHLSFIGSEILSFGSLTALKGDINLEARELNITITGSSEQVSLLGKNATLTAENDLIITNAKIGTIENLRLLAENNIVIRDSALSALQIVSGKDLIIQGNQLIDIFALNHPQSGLFSGENMILRSANTVAGDAHYYSGGSFSIEQLNGELGNLSSPHDPIIRSVGDVEFFAYQGASLHILAGGSINIDTIIIDFADTLENAINPITTPDLSTVILSDGTEIIIDGNTQPTLDIRAGMNLEKIGIPLGTVGENGLFFDEAINPILPPSNNPVPPQRADITIGDIWIDADDGIVLLTNQYEPNISLAGGDILLKEDGFFGDGIYTNRSTGNAGDVILDSRGQIILNNDITTVSRVANSGDVTLLAQDKIEVNHSINTFTAGSAIGEGGTVTLKTATELIIDGTNLDQENAEQSISTNAGLFSIGKSGDIILQASTVNLINQASVFAGTFARFGEGNAGNITITADVVSLDNGSLLGTSSSGQGHGGNIFINSNDQVILDNSSIFETAVFFNGTGNAGQININTGRLEVTNNSSLDAGTSGAGNGGDINIVATDSVIFKEGTFTAASSNVITLPNTDIGSLSRNAGNINITTGSLEVSNGAALESFNNSIGNSGKITINAVENVIFSGALSGIFNNVGSSIGSGNGNGGGIQINANSVSLQEQANLNSSIFGTGNAGDIIIKATGDISLNNINIFTQVEENSVGNAGKIELMANHININNQSFLNSTLSGTGDAGDITIQATEDISLDNSNIFTQVRENSLGNAGKIEITANNFTLTNQSILNTQTSAQGNSGDILINTQGTLSLNNSFINSIVSENAIGEGGNIEINTSNLSLNDSSLISTTTSGEGNAGKITINTVNNLAFENTSGLSSIVRETARGNGGNIEVTGKTLTLMNNGFINTDTFGQGNTGKITVNMQDAITLNQTASLQSAVDETSTGSGQGIEINTNQLTMMNESILATTTQAQGNAGIIQIVANERILLDQGSVISSDIFQATGNGGNINLQTSQLSLLNQSTIQSITSGQGEGGTITVKADNLTFNNQSGILSNTINQGNAGNIAVEVMQSINLDNSQISASASIDTENNIIPTGNGGTIMLQTPFLSLNNASSILSETEGQGNAGSITIPNANNVTLDNNSTISTAIAPTGNATQPSNITLNTQQLNLSNNSQITASTAGKGSSGTITIPDAQNIALNNSTITTQVLSTAQLNPDVTPIPSNLTLNADTFTLTNNSRISASTEGVLNAGNITLITDNLTLSQGSQIETLTRSTANAGTISLNSSKEISISHENSGLFAQTENLGIAGNIIINTPTFNITDNAIVSASTNNAGDGGNITINALNSVVLGNNSQLTVETSDVGKAGDITITSDTLTIGQDAQLSATATATSTNNEGGGSITLNAQNLNISGQLGIFAETQGQSPAGNLTINPNNDNPNLNIRFTDNGFISARTTSAGEGGDISITAPQTVDIQGIGQITVETLGSGNAGIIEIISPTINLAEGLNISASTTGTGNAGNINLYGNQISLSGTEISAFTNSTGNAGSIFLSNQDNTAFQVSLSNNSLISTEIQAQGQATTPSNIEIKTDNLTLNNSTITASTEGMGDAGSITVNDATNINLTQSEISASTSGEGDTGVIDLNASDTLQLNNSDINSAVEQGAMGDSQQITLNTPNLSLTQSNISAATAGQGNAGSIILPNANNLSLDNSTISTAIAPTGNATQPSNITLNTQQLNLNNHSEITASTEGKGDAGSITVPNAININLTQSEITASTASNDNAGEIILNATETISLDNNSSIASRAELSATGDGGNINLQTPNLSLDNQSQISTSSAGEDTADAGTINLDTNQMTLNNSSQISATTSGGEGGSINLNGDTLFLTQGSQIRTTTEGDKDAGNINLILTESLLISDNNSGIFADSSINAQGNSGSIFIDPPLVFLREDATISVNNQGQGFGGDITLLADNLSLDQATILAQTASNTGGNIILNITDTLLMRNSSEISATAGTAQAGGDGGNITITADTILTNLYGNNRITANAFLGNGGNITITADTLYGFTVGDASSPISIITASSNFGFDGNIILNTPDINPLQGIEDLPETNINPQLQQGCQVSGQATAEFYVLGKGGITLLSESLLTPNSYSEMQLIPLANSSLSENAETSHAFSFTPYPLLLLPCQN